MTPNDLRKQFQILEREAQGKDRHKFMPTCVQSGFKENGSVEWAEIRSDAGTLWKYPADHKSLVKVDSKKTYQAWQTRAVVDGKGVEGWRFDEASL